jgi:hypothetical protein
MGKASRDKGAAYERRWAACMKQNGWSDAKRGRDNGHRSGESVAEDQYDTGNIEGLLCDVKAGYAAASPEQEERWLLDVALDAAKRGKRGFLIRNRPGKADPLQWWAHVLGDDYFEWCCLAAGMPHDQGAPMGLEPIRMRAGDLLGLLRSAGYGDQPKPPDPADLDLPNDPTSPGHNLIGNPYPELYDEGVW